MSAYLHVQFSVLDPDALAEYSKLSAATLKDTGGEPVFAAGVSSTLVGEAMPHSHVAVVRFPTEETIDRWLNSTDYKALVPLRNRALTGEVFSVLTET